MEIPASNANISNIDYYKRIAAEYDVILRFMEESAMLELNSKIQDA